MIKNVSYELAATFTREQVLAVGKVAEFVGNIESMLKSDFPSSGKVVDWDQFRTAMTIFRQLYEQDHLAFKALSQISADVNSGKIVLIAGRIYEKEKP